MAEAQPPTDRGVKRMRRIGRILALVWAAWWVLVVLAGVFLVALSDAETCYAESGIKSWISPGETIGEAMGSAGCLAMLALLVLPVWIAAAVPWRSELEAVGGVLLVVAGLLLFCPSASSAMFGIPPVIYGSEMYGTGQLELSGRATGQLLLGCVSVLPVAFPLAAGTLFVASWRKSRTLAAVEDATERPEGWIVYIARALALTSAGLWTVVIGCVALLSHHSYFGGNLGSTSESIGYFGFGAIVPILLAWVTTSISWRWNRIGGVLILLQGLLLPVYYWAVWQVTPVSALDPFFLVWMVVMLPVLLFILPPAILFMILLPLVAGSLFLASWRQSRTPATPQATE